MRPGQARFVTACQQLLVLGAVVAVLTPAASVVSLDVVGRPEPRSVPGSVRPGAHALPAVTLASVPTTVVDPVVREYALTPSGGAPSRPGDLRARASTRSEAGSPKVVSTPVPVTGYGSVGVSWAAGSTPSPDDVGFAVRTRTGSAWSTWTPLAYDPDHGPDPTSAEARGAQPGTDPLLVGEVDEVQVRVDSSDGALPAGMKLAVIDPGTAPQSRVEAPAIDTGGLDPAPGSGGAAPAPGAAPTAAAEPGPGLELQASTFTPKPQIFSRAQWGADESIREKSALHYYEVHAGFVHHTVNANDYTRAQVPALIRGIYAYHVRVRGWSDIGYNLLVDRFGRVWEGRYGGVDRPVVGAHTLGYNDYSFAMSAIGNYELVKPSARVLRAYGRVFAWKLSLHGVDAASTRQVVGPSRFPAINGHRDAASTACPGRYLYERLPTIRALAAADQQGWSGRERATDLASTPHPDLIVRRATDGKGFVIPTGGGTSFGRPVPVPSAGSGLDLAVPTPDVTGDDHGDLAVRDAAGVLRIVPGDGSGGFDAPIRPTRAFRGLDQLAAAGDLDEDGRHDLVARDPSTGRLLVFLGNGRGRFTTSPQGRGWERYRRISGAGDVDGDGHADLVAQDAAGTLWLRPGRGTGRFGGPVAVAGGSTAFDVVTGIGDFTEDGRPDLFVRSAATGLGSVLPSRGATGFGRPLGRLPRSRGLAALGAADLTGTPEPDLVGLRGGRVVLLRNAGTVELAAPIATGLDLSGADKLLNVGDWDRDGHGDVVTRDATTGALSLYRGRGNGRFSAAVTLATGFHRVRLLAAVGDMTGDGWPDLMGQPARGSMRIYPGAGLEGLRLSYVAYGSISADAQVGVGRWDGDGAPDSLLRRGAQLRVYPGNGPGGLVNRVSTVDLDLTRYDWVLGIGDARLTGPADLVVRERGTGYLWLLPRSGSGFAPRVFLGEGLDRFDLAG